MAEQRYRTMLSANVNGHPLMAEVEEFTPPELKHKMEDSQGGKFIPDEVWVGLEKLTFELKIAGAGVELLQQYGLKHGEICQVDIKAAERDKDGGKFIIHYSLSGQLTGIKEEAIKMGSKPEVTISGSCIAFKKTENGKTLCDINTRTQKIDLGQGDIFAEDRRGLGLP
ncbi:phage major tail tube protein [Spartinivicinus ruber]|uniref:phage major tail tube protein n=1 Tax=Spartinivicinus ruber TaxID=2683272 RepID=UPI0013D6DF2A|nr:phage major tail tube protein [Spartinivicinus ruber]